MAPAMASFLVMALMVEMHPHRPPPTVGSAQSLSSMTIGDLTIATDAVSTTVSVLGDPKSMAFI